MLSNYKYLYVDELVDISCKPPIASRNCIIFWFELKKRWVTLEIMPYYLGSEGGFVSVFKKTSPDPIFGQAPGQNKPAASADCIFAIVNML